MVTFWTYADESGTTLIQGKLSFFKVPEGVQHFPGGSNFFQGVSNFFQGGGGPIAYSLKKPV